MKDRGWKAAPTGWVPLLHTGAVLNNGAAR